MNGNRMLDAFLHHGRHRSGRTARKITQNMLLSENGQCYLWTAGMKGKNNRYGVIRCEFRGKKGQLMCIV